MIAITLYVIGGIAIQISPSQTVDLNSVPSQPLPTICGDIVNANQEYSQSEASRNWRAKMIMC